MTLQCERCELTERCAVKDMEGWFLCPNVEGYYNTVDRLRNSIYGLIVGDALGVPVEFKPRNSFVISDMVGYGTYNQPAGTWSDDSSMVLATMDSIIKCEGKIKPKDIMKRFYLWLQCGNYTPYGKVFDVGNTTRMAINRYSQGVPLKDCGGKSYTDNGNGSLMRILPLAFMQCTDAQIAEVSALTHANEVSKDACIIYITIAKRLLDGDPLLMAIKYGAEYSALSEFSRLIDIHMLGRGEIRSTGYVVDTLEAALWCLTHSCSYRECVLQAVNLGGDTDTIAAVAGGLAGLMWKVPDVWIKQLASLDYVTDIINKFMFIQDYSTLMLGNLNV